MDLHVAYNQHSTLSAERDWFKSVDLTDAYFQVPIAVHHRKFLRFSCKNQTYQFRVLPFGFSLAPRVFTRCIKAAMSPLWSQGLWILLYLDDFLLCTQMRDQAVHDCQLLLDSVAKLRAHCLPRSPLR